jgi:hypothetical protein
MKNKHVMDMERMRQSRFRNQLIKLHRDFIAEQSRIAGSNV